MMAATAALIDTIRKRSAFYSEPFFVYLLRCLTSCVSPRWRRKNAGAQGRFRTLEGFIQNIADRPLTVDVFDERLWHETVDTARANLDGSMTFFFRNGSEITA
ncbi:MAG: hypothetical protein LBQ80_05985 [Clostridium sp.]|jgi:hypothetical protein|nr:hypothetical protein [Clostridium sp.]